MVRRKELLKENARLKSENEKLAKENNELKAEKEVREKATEKQITMLFNALRAINKKVNTHIKGEKDEKEEDDKVQNWLKDDRIDEVQDFLNKGVK
ncbi:MAG: hypothetical protein IJ301_00025 [Clostridia bacterium]|nr:hypothetical protein [Clostridia bacterium]